MKLRTCGRPALLVMALLAAPLDAHALPIGPVVAGPQIDAVQYSPGHNSRLQYRRALRRYRGHPGGRFELRQNRRIFCRNTPERC